MAWGGGTASSGWPRLYGHLISRMPRPGPASGPAPRTGAACCQPAAPAPVLPASEPPLRSSPPAAPAAPAGAVASSDSDSISPSGEAPSQPWMGSSCLTVGGVEAGARGVWAGSERGLGQRVPRVWRRSMLSHRGPPPACRATGAAHIPWRASHRAPPARQCQRTQDTSRTRTSRRVQERHPTHPGTCTRRCAAP